MLLSAERDETVEHDVCPPCTYFQHKFTQEAQHRLSAHTIFLYWLLLLLAAVIIIGLIVSAVLGFNLGAEGSNACLSIFFVLSVMHAFIFDPLKVFLLTVIAIFFYEKLPW